ncbi:unnamed protein product, partial [Acanthoscelides obtectus]
MANSSGGRSSRLFGLLISRRALCWFESRPRRNFSLGYGCCDCPWYTVSDCRTWRYHLADLVGGARMCACCKHTCSLARVRVAFPLS